MDLQLNSTYDDSLFNDSVDQTQNTEHKLKGNSIASNSMGTESPNKVDTAFQDRGDESALTIEDTTLDTTLTDKIDPSDIGNSVTEANVELDAVSKDKFSENFQSKTDVKVSQMNRPKKTKDNLFQLIDTLTSPPSENGTSGLPTKRVTIRQDTRKPPQANYLRLESEVYSSISSEFESKNVNNPEDIYFYSGFPSLFSYLGPNATNRTLKCKKNKQKLPPIEMTVNGVYRNGRNVYQSPSSILYLHQKMDGDNSPKTNAQKEHTTFAQEMRKRNESQWLRIEAVAKEKMDLHERYAVDMTIRIRKQREKINRRSQELLTSLARMEEQKKEDKLYDSPHGRIWRHHRSMQRRVFNLEPMSMRDKGLMSMKQSSARSGQTGA